MAAELHDLRAKITPEAHCAIEAVHRATKRDHSEIVREVLHEWAMREIRRASVLRGLLLAEGLHGRAE